MSHSYNELPHLQQLYKKNDWVPEGKTFLRGNHLIFRITGELQEMDF